MVRTRHSLAAPIEDDEQLELEREGGEQPKWMKELQIDGKETLKGEKKTSQPKGTYTWRGAVYAIDENTPKEWIEAEADRQTRSSLKKDRGHSQTPTVTADADASPRLFANRKPKSKPHEVQRDGGSNNANKRARGEESAAEGATRVAKKPRKNLNSLKDKSAQPERHYLFPSLNAQSKKKKSKPKSDLPRFDPSGSASQKTREEVEQSRKKAKDRDDYPANNSAHFEVHAYLAAFGDAQVIHHAHFRRRQAGAEQDRLQYY
ncbi:hypothetical protein BST61_g10245 [Cercospora zeina]